MRIPVLAVLGLLVIAGTGVAQTAPSPGKSKKQQALERIENLLAEGHLDDAKQAIDHLLEHNPGDADLLALLEVWRIRKGRVGPLIEGKDLDKPEKRKELRECAWKIVEATAAGNPEELAALADAGDPERAKKLVARVAPDGLPEPELEPSGDARSEPLLRKALRSDRPIEAVRAMRELLRRGGKGKTPIRDLYVAVRDDDQVLRGKPTMLALAIEALGDSKEPGAREFLEGLLDDADHRVDAARALGALGDTASIPALLAFLTAPPPEEEDTAGGGGLAFLGRSEALKNASEAEAVRPLLVGALALLRITA